MQDQGRARDERDMGEMMEELEALDEAGDADFVFTCGLTMEPFRDPVITPDGNSYERCALVEHLNKVCYYASALLSARVFTTVACDRQHRLGSA